MAIPNHLCHKDFGRDTFFNFSIRVNLEARFFDFESVVEIGHFPSNHC